MRALFAKNKVRFARAEQLYGPSNCCKPTLVDKLEIAQLSRLTM